MKRLALLFLFGALAASAQEVRLNRAVLLKSERTLVSLRSGTMVNLLSRDDQMVTVRFNNHTGTIPADSLAPAGAARLAGTSLRAPAMKLTPNKINLANLAKESAENCGQNNASRTDLLLAAN
jgi:hypothetical protein